VDEVVAKLREAKKERAAGAAEASKTFGKHDFYITSLSAIGAVGIHSFAWALPYMTIKFGEIALANSEMGQRWLSQVTPKDISVINEVLAKAPEERGPVTRSVTNALIEKAKKGEKLPPLSVFQSLLNKAQLGAILRVVAPPVQSQVQQPSNPAP
jgi:hypothetical protein